MIEEHCSPESADAANSPPVEIDSNQHQEAATVPPDRIGSDPGMCPGFEEWRLYKSVLNLQNL